MDKNTQYDQGDLIEVRFLDIHETSDWTDVKKAVVDTPTKCKVTGYFICEDDELLKVALMVNNLNEVSYTVIPRGVIQDIRKIEDAELQDFDKEE